MALCGTLAMLASADAATTLQIKNRVLRGGELKGFTPKPKAKVITGAAAFARLSGGTAAQRAAHTARLRQLGFSAGIVQRLVPTRARLADGLSIVSKLSTDINAAKELEGQFADAIAVARATKATLEEVVVTGIPSAKGYTVTLPEFGAGGAGVFFVDGRYCYLVSSASADVTPRDVQQAALRLYKRVKGRP